MRADDPRHGTVAGYNRIPCREECCRAAIRRYKQLNILRHMKGQPGMVPALGLQRRVRALAALGWSNAQVARAAGIHPEHLPRMLRSEFVHRQTFERVAAAYTRLSELCPPTETRYQKIGVNATRNRAQRNNWPPPQAWLNIDDPDEQPDPGYQPPRRSEEVELIEDMVAIGLSVHEIGSRLGVQAETVLRRCERNGRTDLLERMKGAA